MIRWLFAAVRSLSVWMKGGLKYPRKERLALGPPSSSFECLDNCGGGNAPEDTAEKESAALHFLRDAAFYAERKGSFSKVGYTVKIGVTWHLKRARLGGMPVIRQVTKHDSETVEIVFGLGLPPLFTTASICKQMMSPDY